jgi:hypothetical protein
MPADSNVNDNDGDIVLACKLSASLHDAIFYHFDDVCSHGFASWFYWFKGNSVRNPTSSKPSQGDRSIGGASVQCHEPYKHGSRCGSIFMPISSALISSLRK